MAARDLLHKPTPEEINALPLKSYEGEVKLVRTPEQWAKALPDLKEFGLVGFDTETRPTFTKGKVNAPALIQLATARAVYLVQLEWWPFGEECASFLADPSVIKVGVGIDADFAALARIHPFQPAGGIDLGELAKSHNMPAHGLRTLAASLFGWRISKGSQCSNWSSPVLTPKQISYAATDAWIGRMIYLRLSELGMGAPKKDMG